MDNAKVRGRILHLLDTLDRATTDLLTDLDNFSEQDLNGSSNQGIWSPMQVLNHLLASERGSLAYVKKKLSFDPKLKKSGPVTGLRWLLLKIFLYSPFKFKAPRGVDTPNLPAYSKLAEAVEAWKSHRKSLRTFIETVDEKRLAQEVYKHPIAGRLSIMHMIQFFRHHLYRHRRQIYSRLPQAIR